MGREVNIAGVGVCRFQAPLMTEIRLLYELGGKHGQRIRRRAVLRIRRQGSMVAKRPPPEALTCAACVTAAAFAGGVIDGGSCHGRKAGKGGGRREGGGGEGGGRGEGDPGRRGTPGTRHLTSYTTPTTISAISSSTDGMLHEALTLPLATRVPAATTASTTMTLAAAASTTTAPTTTATARMIPHSSTVTATAGIHQPCTTTAPYLAQTPRATGRHCMTTQAIGASHAEHPFTTGGGRMRGRPASSRGTRVEGGGQRRGGRQHR